MSDLAFAIGRLAIKSVRVFFRVALLFVALG
jgi:hypothetical protein